MTLEDVIGYLNGRIQIKRHGVVFLDFKWEEPHGYPVFNVGDYETLDQLLVCQRTYIAEIRAERKNVFLVEIEFDSDFDE